MKKNTLQFLIIALISCCHFSGFSQISLTDDNYYVSACNSTLDNLGNVLSNDSFDGNNFNSSDFIVTADSIYYYNTTTTVPFMTLDGSGNILNSNVYFVGSIVITYSVYRIADGTFSTAVAQVNIDPPTTLAVNDNYTFVIGIANSPYNILQNDLFCGMAPLNRNFIQWNLLSSLPAGVTFDMFGEVIVDPTTIPGVYNIPYEISNLNPVGPQAWTSAIFVLTVIAPSVNAENDVYNYIIPTSGYGCTTSILANDFINGSAIPLVLGYPTISFSGAALSNFSISYDQICFPSTISPGTYVINYGICPANAAGLCDYATVTINLTAVSSSSFCLPASQDTMIHEYETTRNFGANTVLQPSRWTYDAIGGNGFYTTKTLHKFDLSTIPSGTTIPSAYLTLHVDVTDSLYFQHLDDSGGVYGNGITVNEIATPWNENTVTWNTAPTTLPGFSSLSSLGNATTTDVIVDVTAMVQNMVNTGVNNGFMMSVTNNSDYYHSVVFASRENTSTGGIYKPELCINLPTLKNENFVANAFLIYPNPANDFLNISGQENIQKTELYDLNGRLVFHSSEEKNQATLSLENIPTGMYFLKIITENGTETKKIFKN